MLNQGLLEDQAEMSSQMVYFNSLSLPFGCNQILQQAPFAESPKPKEDHFGGTQQLLSIQRSSHINLWQWGEDSDCIISSSAKRRISGVEDHKNNNLGISATKMKKIKSTRRKVREPRFCFKTLSDVDVLDDGYKWRKYGQKVVKNTQHPRSYYRCTQDNCRVKKRVERLAEDPRMVITTYEGRHAHSPSHDEENNTSSQLNHFFW